MAQEKLFQVGGDSSDSSDSDDEEYGISRRLMSAEEAEEDLAVMEKETLEQRPQRIASMQTIVRRRRRRNPYARHAGRHYKRLLPFRRVHGSKMSNIIRKKEMGLPSASSDTESTDLSRITTLTEFTNYEEEPGIKAIQAMLPVFLFAKLFLQFPVSIDARRGGLYLFRFHWWHPCSILFFIIGIFAFFVWVVSAWNFYKFQTIMPVGKGLWDVKNYTREDQHFSVIMDRNLIPFFVIMLGYMNLWVLTLCFYLNRLEIPNYLNFMSRALKFTKIDASEQVLTYALLGIGFYLVMLCVMAVVHLLKYTATAVGAPTTAFLIFLRQWRLEESLLKQDDDGNFSEWFYRLQTISTVVLLYIIFVPKIYILLFLIFQKVLQNCFRKWNGRAYTRLLMEDTKADYNRGRCTFRLLFRDHCVITELLRKTSEAMGSIMEAVIITDCVSSFVLLYLFGRVWKYGKRRQLAFTGNFFIRPYDWIIVFFYLTVNVPILVFSMVVSSSVTEIAHQGLEIIQRNLLIGRRSDDKLRFVLSIFASFTYSHYFEFSGSGLFFVNKDFVQTIASTIFSYFIIALQFMPPLDTDHEGNCAVREQIGDFLTNFEGLKKGHWKPVGEECDAGLQYYPASTSSPTDLSSVSVSSTTVRTATTAAAENIIRTWTDRTF